MAIDRGKSQTASLLTGTVWRTLTQPGSLVSIQTAASEVAQLALTAQEGDVVIRSDEDKVYMHNSSYGGTISDWTVFAVTNDYVDDATVQIASITGSTTLDFTTYDNFILTLTGDVTLENPSTEVVGKSGFIAFIQDGTGSRTVSIGSDFKTGDDLGINLTTVANKTNIVPYYIVAANKILLGTNVAHSADDSLTFS